MRKTVSQNKFNVITATLQTQSRLVTIKRTALTAQFFGRIGNQKCQNDYEIACDTDGAICDLVILQINHHHCKQAKEALADYVLTHKIDNILGQDTFVQIVFQSGSHRIDPFIFL